MIDINFLDNLKRSGAMCPEGAICGLSILLILLLPSAACGAALQVAVASNFRTTLEQLAPGFNRGQAEDIKVSSGSSGMLYAQIVHGAPFDVFLSADSSYPRRLEQDGLAVHRRTYARGILVLVYQPELAELAQSGAAAILSRPGLSLAIANPRLAPYGIAAQQVLERLGSKPSPLLRGANISQAYQMWSSGGADAALIARSQALAPWLDLPREWYGDMQQQAVLLGRTPNLSKARDFLQWLLSPAIQAAIAGAGFNPGVNTHGNYSPPLLRPGLGIGAPTGGCVGARHASPVWCDPQTHGARMTDGGPCARRVRHGAPFGHRAPTTCGGVSSYYP